jgi:hypothetical protein
MGPRPFPGDGSRRAGGVARDRHMPPMRIPLRRGAPASSRAPANAGNRACGSSARTSRQATGGPRIRHPPRAAGPKHPTRGEARAGSLAAASLRRKQCAVSLFVVSPMRESGDSDRAVMAIMETDCRPPVPAVDSDSRV